MRFAIAAAKRWLAIAFCSHRVLRRAGLRRSRVCRLMRSVLSRTAV